MTWYILRTATRREKRAEAALKEIGVRAYCPKIIRWERIGRRAYRDIREHPLFPGYMFAVIPDGAFAAVEATDGVSGVLRAMGASGEYAPHPISDKAVSALQQAEMAGDFDRTRDVEDDGNPKPGDVLRVKSGGWWGHSATVVRMVGAHRVKVLLMLFGKQNEVELDVAKLERVA